MWIHGEVMEEQTPDTGKYEVVFGFTGNHPLKLDSALRVAVPSKFKEVLETLYSTCSSRVRVVPARDCLEVYPEPEWVKMQQHLNSLPPFDPDSRRIKTYKFGNMKHCGLDAQNRIQLTPGLCKLVDLKKDVVVAGQQDHMQIWDAEKWNLFNSDVRDNHDEVMARAGTAGAGSGA